MKNKKIVIISTFFIIAITLLCYMINLSKEKAQINALKYKEVTGTTVYHDWSEINTDNLTAGVISPEYSYSTIFYTENTEFKILKTAGTISWLTNAAGVKIPQVSNLKENDEFIMQITNCAVNKAGKMLDVVIKINNIDVWESGYIYFYTKNSILFLNSQNYPVPEGDYSVNPNTGDPISFELGSATANCDYTMTYYESGTYNLATDSGVLGNINHINGLYHDIDVPGGDSYLDQILDGREGIAPIVGKSTIYYNKSQTQPLDTSYATYLREIDNGLAVVTVNGNTNSIWYGNGMFMMTEDITNSTLKFKYAGQGCGIYYIFSAPYPYGINAPTVSVSSNEITRNQTITYKINQIVPNNYYGSVMNFSEVFPNLHNSTRFNTFQIRDTIDSNFIINGNITITDINNNNVTSYFNITTQGNTITAVGKPEYYNQLVFYNNNYTINVPVSLKSGQISKKTIPNQATTTAQIGTNTNSESYNSNVVNVNVYYYVTVKHLIEGTNTELASSEKIKKYHGDTYTTNMLSNIPSNYEYSSRTSNYTGTATDNVTVTYYYKLKKGTLTVNHLEEGTNKVLSPQEVSTLNYTSNYQTSPSTNALKTHEVSKTPNNATGTIGGNVTVTYYYKKKASQLTVKYLEDQTNKELAPSKTTTVYYGDTYTTSTSTSVPNNYELLRKTSNYTGVVSTNTIEVIYYYQKKDSSLNTSITKEGPKEITKKDEATEYRITYTASVTDYIGNGTITIIDTLPYHIDTEKSELSDGIYDEETNTITWTIPWNEIDSFNNKGSTTIEKNISLVYNDLKPTDRIMINSVKGSIKLDNNSRDTESQTSTQIKIPSTITVHHYEKDTKIKLIEDEKFTELVGETLTTSPLKKDGYIIHKPETEIYTFTEEDQEVIYEYERIKVHISTIVDGIGGTIEGDEDVSYGDDSTKDKIVIKPDEGYILSEVYINGKKVELTDEEKGRLILNNFTELKEDKKIMVKFTQDTGVLDNVATGTFANFIVILVIVFLSVLIYLKVSKSKLIKLK